MNPGANTTGTDATGAGTTGSGLDSGLASGIATAIQQAEAAKKDAEQTAKYKAAQAQGEQSNATALQKARQVMANLGLMSPGDDTPGAAPAGAWGAPTRITGAVTPRAAPALLRTAQALPESSAARQAMTKMGLGDYQAAKQILDQQLLVNDKDPFAFRLRAFALRKLGDLPGSAKDAKSALALAPKDPWSRSIFMDDLTDMGRAKEALEAADGAPLDARTLVARSRAWDALGRKDLALNDLKEAAALDAQFEGLYESALAAAAPKPRKLPHPNPGVLWLAAAGTAMLFFSALLFKHTGFTRITRRVATGANRLAPLLQPVGPALPVGFAIVRTLGQGGMGVVYEATDLALQRPVAIKKLREEVAGNPRERARFLKEARTVAALHHPNIVEIHSVQEDDNGLFLVFEKVNGQTLHERLGRGPLTPVEAAGVLKQIATALDYAHSKGIVHQDLKPGNVMVDAANTAKVMDFGIARRVQETLSTLSKLEVAGTPAYMAPEQEAGQLARPAADVYALGACAYELLCGRPPFPSSGATMMMKAQKMFNPVSALVPGLSPKVDEVLTRALEPEPAKRWPSAGAFASALSGALGAAPA